jgi:hypothetical protein
MDVNKEPHAMSKDHIKPCLVETVKLVLKCQHAKKVDEISHLKCTENERISEMSEDILD